MVIVAAALGVLLGRGAPAATRHGRWIGGNRGVPSAPRQAQVRSAIRLRLATVRAPFEASTDDRTKLTALYGGGGDTPLWVDAVGRPRGIARDAIALLEDASDEGLSPSDYDARTLVDLAAAVSRGNATATTIADFDVGLSLETLRYLRHLHLGRVDPRSVGLDLQAWSEGHDLVALLQRALTGGSIVALASALAPQFVQYRSLRAALERYRALATDVSLVPPPVVDRPIAPGVRYPGAPELRRWLTALGDLAVVPTGSGQDTAASDSERYDAGLVEAVRRFQARHGLEPDGIVGPATFSALRVPLAWRVRQIELALERLRWLPDLDGRPFVAMNIPMFRLWAWDAVRPDGIPDFETDVVVGRALRTETPVFIEDLQYLVFRPYWNVPLSIVRREILPAIAEEPGYLDRYDMELVRGEGGDAVPVEVNDMHLAQAATGAVRVRQRPGPHNALGLVKFIFPNDEHVYLHGTPATELFAHARRDFSHGCVRVADPVGLAAWVLRDQPGWTREAIIAAMHDDGPPRRVDLSRPIRVILFYLTAVVVPESGTIRFAEDIYGHDRTLDHRLSALVTER